MNAKYLLAKSKASLTQAPDKRMRFDFFGQGAKWMFEQMKLQHPNRLENFDSTINYAFYGYLKYLAATCCFLVSFLFLRSLNYYLLPIAFVLFYWVEVHFLFLFPLLIDKVEKPILSSIAMTYRVGVWKSILVVIPIGFYMVIGLLRFKNPLFNWYVGCLAILIWYGDEARDRV